MLAPMGHYTMCVQSLSLVLKYVNHLEQKLKLVVLTCYRNIPGLQRGYMRACKTFLGIRAGALQVSLALCGY